MAKILVTGGAGFIGGYLCRRLVAEGAEVVVVDDLSSGKADNVPAEAHFVRGSVLDPGLMAAASVGIDLCYHLAAVASVQRCNADLVASHRTNMAGFVGLIELLASRPAVPLVYASSAAVYGASLELPLGEQLRVEPLSPYGADKRGCELHARAAFEVYGLASTGLRFFNVYGPGQDPSSPYSGVISKFADRIAAGKPLTIFGDGRQTRDFVFVGDVVEALIRAGRDPAKTAEVFNVCTGREVSILELADTMQTASGIDREIELAEALKGEVRRSCGDTSALEQRFGLRPTTTLAEGLLGLRG